MFLNGIRVNYKKKGESSKHVGAEKYMKGEKEVKAVFSPPWLSVVNSSEMLNQYPKVLPPGGGVPEEGPGAVLGPGQGDHPGGRGVPVPPARRLILNIWGPWDGVRLRGSRLLGTWVDAPG